MDNTITLTENAMSIQNSYRIIMVALMEIIIDQIKEEHTVEDYPILNRSTNSFVNEWASHNLLYNLGIARSHTETVDFEYPQKTIYKIGYWILGNIYKIFY